MSIKVNIRPQDLKRFNKDVQSYVKDQDRVIKQALDITALHVAGDAKELAPVDKGILRASIHPKGLGKKEKKRQVIAGVFYAKFVEFGTIKQKAQPFMNPARVKNLHTFQKAFKRLFKQI